MRGPSRDGLSKETGLIDRWALNGENFLWRAPYGGRSAPIVLGNRVYVQNPDWIYQGETLRQVGALSVSYLRQCRLPQAATALVTRTAPPRVSAG